MDRQRIAATKAVPPVIIFSKVRTEGWSASEHIRRDPNSLSETIGEIRDDAVRTERFHLCNDDRLVDGIDEHGEMCVMEPVY